jgi:hypothetical protein
MSPTLECLSFPSHLVIPVLRLTTTENYTEYAYCHKEVLGLVIWSDLMIFEVIDGLLGYPISKNCGR